MGTSRISTAAAQDISAASSPIWWTPSNTDMRVRNYALSFGYVDPLHTRTGAVRTIVGRASRSYTIEKGNGNGGADHVKYKVQVILR